MVKKNIQVSLKVKFGFYFLCSITCYQITFFVTVNFWNIWAMFTFSCVNEQVCGFQQVVLFGVLNFSDYY